MEKNKVIEAMRFGQRVAEDEGRDLLEYFVETDQWKKIQNGDVDIVYGPKGAGKSALYTLLTQGGSPNPQISIIAAENPRGNTVFQAVETEPPTNEASFELLWKIYFLSLIGKFLHEGEIQNQNSTTLIDKLREEGLLEGSNDAILKRILKKINSVEGGISIDPATGTFSGSSKITFRDPEEEARKAGYISVDELLSIAEKALEEASSEVWIAIDRLDKAFKENEELEENALRALFHVYLDFLKFNKIELKIFLRTDIWKRLSAKGFREASHITKHMTISWPENKLLNLVIRRVLNNPTVIEYFGVDKEEILSDINKQKEFFYKIFPNQVDSGEKKPETLKWMLTRTADGSEKTAPRELIHLLTQVREEEQKSIELGSINGDQSPLFQRTSLKDALPEVSTTRIEQTIYAEYPELKPFIEKLEGEKAEHSPQTLAKIWEEDEGKALEIANNLVGIGFFQKRGGRLKPSFLDSFSL